VATTGLIGDKLPMMTKDYIVFNPIQLHDMNTAIELKFILTKPNGDKILKDLAVDNMEEFTSLLVKASAWSNEELSGVKGRKAHAFCPGWFSTTTVDGLLNYWTPRYETQLKAHFVPELDYSI
jgi:hypothetical protein